MIGLSAKGPGIRERRQLGGVSEPPMPTPMEQDEVHGWGGNFRGEREYEEPPLREPIARVARVSSLDG
eukprot:1337642-Amorphochlora_amoeboformis.AAC.1